ncbi:MAG: hypothetical protein ACKVQC_01170, partial [Elusimicrobiota bacterium]
LPLIRRFYVGELSSEDYDRTWAPAIENLLVFAAIAVMNLGFGMNFFEANQWAWSVFAGLHAVESLVGLALGRAPPKENTFWAVLIAGYGVLTASVFSAPDMAFIAMALYTTALHLFINNYVSRRKSSLSSLVNEIDKKFMGDGWNKTTEEITQRLKADTQWRQKASQNPAQLLKLLEPTQDQENDVFPSLSFNKLLSRKIKLSSGYQKGSQTLLGALWFECFNKFLDEFISMTVQGVSSENISEEKMAQILTDAAFYLHLSAVVLLIQADLTSTKTTPKAQKALLSLDKLLRKNSSTTQSLIAKAIPSAVSAYTLVFSPGIFDTNWDKHDENNVSLSKTFSRINKTLNRNLLSLIESQYDHLVEAESHWPYELLEPLRLLSSVAVLNHLDALMYGRPHDLLGIRDENIRSNSADIKLLNQHLPAIVDSADKGDKKSQEVLALILLVFPELIGKTDSETDEHTAFGRKPMDPIGTRLTALQGMMTALNERQPLESLSVSPYVFTYQFILEMLQMAYTSNNPIITVDDYQLRSTAWTQWMSNRPTSFSKNKQIEDRIKSNKETTPLVRRFQVEQANKVLQPLGLKLSPVGELKPTGKESEIPQQIEAVISALEKGDRMKALTLIAPTATSLQLGEETNQLPPVLEEWSKWLETPGHIDLLKEKLSQPSSADSKKETFPLDIALMLTALQATGFGPIDDVPNIKRKYGLTGNEDQNILMAAMLKTGLYNETEWWAQDSKQAAELQILVNKLKRIDPRINIKIKLKGTDTGWGETTAIFVLSEGIQAPEGANTVLQLDKLIGPAERANIQNIDRILRLILAAA